MFLVKKYFSLNFSQDLIPTFNQEKWKNVFFTEISNIFFLFFDSQEPKIQKFVLTFLKDSLKFTNSQNKFFIDG